MVEEWRSINGFFGYEVSNEGQVRSFKKNGPGTLFRNTPKLMKLTEDKDGYYKVGLRHNGIQRILRVNRLVALEFIENPQKLPVTNHKDGNKKNNNKDNLEWATFQSNTQHAFNMGLAVGNRGEKCVNSKLKSVDIELIRSRVLAGESQRSVSKDYPVSYQQISRIIRKENWLYG